MTPPTDSCCYSIRRVNPFLGVLQVIETPGGRALTTNGVTWNIELRTERKDGWGSLNKDNKRLAFYRYGIWSDADGLVLLSRYSQVASDPHLAEHCDQVIKSIQHRSGQLPFPLQDNKELWLFDELEKRPLALLATASSKSVAPKPEPKYWSACQGNSGLAGQHRFLEADKLEESVERRAGFNIHKRWIIRDSEGAGTVVDENMLLDREQFPVFLLREDWESDEEQQRAHDYLCWITPALLTLQNLEDSERQRMEPNVVNQSISIEHHWRLFPKIIDQDIINVARTQSRLQHAL